MLCSVLFIIVFNGVLSWRPEGADPYEILGLPREPKPDAQTLKKAYRQAALQWHPDKVPPEKKEEAEKKFISIAWAFEVLSDPSQSHQYDQPHAQQGQGHSAGGESKPRDFSMEEAAKVFRDVFGQKSAEYRELVDHLATAAGSGNKEQWRKHAEAIKEQVSAGKKDNFEVETNSEDGNERMKTSRKVTKDKKGRTTSTVKTEHTSTTVSHGPGALPHGHAHQAALSAHEAHMKAHEEAVRRAQEAHQRALGGAGHHLPGGRTEL